MSGEAIDGQDPRLTILLVVPGAWHAPELERAWREQGHRVVVVTSSPDAFPGAETRPVRIRLLGRVLARLTRSQTIRPVLFTRLAARIVAREEADVLVVWSGAALELGDRADLPAAAILVRGNHHVRTQAGLLSDAPQGSWRPSSAYVRREEAEYARFPVSVPTDEIAQDPAWGSATVHVSGYGFPPCAEDAPQQPDGPLRLVFLGEPGWRKGLDRVDRLARLDGVDYVTVIGAGGDDIDALSPKLRFIGRQDRSGITDVFRRSHALVLLSREEGQARAGLEALAAGLPLIVTRETGLASFCSAGAGVVVDADATADEHAAALSTVAADWPALSRRAREIAAARSWRDHADEVLDAAREAVDAR